MHLVENYIQLAGGGNITRAQVVQAEILTLIQQLEGHGQHTGPPPAGSGLSWGFNLRAFWRNCYLKTLLETQDP